MYFLLPVLMIVVYLKVYGRVINFGTGLLQIVDADINVAVTIVLVEMVELAICYVVWRFIRNMTAARYQHVPDKPKQDEQQESE